MKDVFHLGIKALICNSERRVLLLKVNPQELKRYQGEAYWDIPGGRIQKGSNVGETLRREVKEETGIKKIISFKQLVIVVSNIRIPLKDGSDVGLILSVYVCDVGEVDEIRLSKEHIDYGWFTVKEATKLLAFKYPEELTGLLRELR